MMMMFGDDLATTMIFETVVNEFYVFFFLSLQKKRNVIYEYGLHFMQKYTDSIKYTFKTCFFFVQPA